MLDNLTPWLVQGGAVGVLMIFVLAILTGRLVPRAVAREMVDVANKHAEQSRLAATVSDQRADEAVRLLGEVLSALRAVETMVRASHRDAT